jgi:hypothetical protein
MNDFLKTLLPSSPETAELNILAGVSQNSWLLRSVHYGISCAHSVILSQFRVKKSHALNDIGTFPVTRSSGWDKKGIISGTCKFSCTRRASTLRRKAAFVNMRELGGAASG